MPKAWSKRHARSALRVVEKGTAHVISLRKALLAGLCLLLLAGPAAALFGPPSAIIIGRVNFMAPTNFTILTKNNEMYRVMIPRDKGIPVDVQLGTRVQVRVVQGTDGQWYLDNFEKIERQPSP